MPSDKVPPYTNTTNTTNPSGLGATISSSDNCDNFGDSDHSGDHSGDGGGRDGDPGGSAHGGDSSRNSPSAADVRRDASPDNHRHSKLDYFLPPARILTFPSVTLYGLASALSQRASRIRTFWQRHSQPIASAAMAVSRWTERSLTIGRIFSFPHLLVALWIPVALWGERWVFHSTVARCDWKHWENWPPDAEPHHLVLIADPQITDPHTYPGRPWPLSALTIRITDNYVRRSFDQLLQRLSPESVFFLGDLFDGGREWKTARGRFEDPAWAPHPQNEQKYLRRWHKKYGEDYWLREYMRFSDLFFKPWIEAGKAQADKPTRRKWVASLPGNHDIGFGSAIKLPVRERFEAYFGEGNRVDVVGNHTIVSVDTVSLSAGTSGQAGQRGVRDIFQPTLDFLDDVKRRKQRAVERELRYQRGESPDPTFHHRVESLDKVTSGSGEVGSHQPVADLPTILLTHVPLWRPPATPCGPMRERWPPTKPPGGQKGPVSRDERNAISVSRGYQYQNVLGESDSIRLLSKIGNVQHAFSGDDHDYCELVHAENQGNVHEITVKSISMAMGVADPGFLMLSMYHPIDPADGKPLSGPAAASYPTIQTHLCLLPNQLAIYTRYAVFAVISILLLMARAVLVPVLRLAPFAAEPMSHRGPGGGRRHGRGRAGGRSPLAKVKMDDYEEEEYAYSPQSAVGYWASSPYHSDRKRSASRTHQRSTSRTRDRSGSSIRGIRPGGLTAQARTARSLREGEFGGRSGGGGGGGGSAGNGNGHAHDGKWGWGRGLRIEIGGENEDDYYPWGGGRWRAASARSGSAATMMLREMWASVFRVAWMVGLVFAWIVWKG